MARYHLKEDGDPGFCTAKEGHCPLGGDHFPSEESARKNYELKMSQTERGAFTGKKKSFHVDPNNLSVSHCHGKKSCPWQHFSKREEADSYLEKLRNEIYEGPLGTPATAEQYEKLREEIQSFLKDNLNKRFYGKGNKPVNPSSEFEELIGDFLSTKYSRVEPEPFGHNQPGDWRASDYKSYFWVEVKTSAEKTTSDNNNSLSAIKMTNDVLERDPSYAQAIIVNALYETGRDVDGAYYKITGIAECAPLWKVAAPNPKRPGNAMTKDNSFMWSQGNGPRYASPEAFIEEAKRTTPSAR